MLRPASWPEAIDVAVRGLQAAGAREREGSRGSSPSAIGSAC